MIAYFFIIMALLALLARMITVLTHELAHCLMARIFTSGKIEVFVGSYGDKAKCLRFAFAKMSFFLKWNVFLWNMGLCVYSQPPRGKFKNFLIIIAGPLVSLIIFFIAMYMAFVYQPGGFYEGFYVVMAASSLIDFLHNITPSDKPIYLKDGTTIWNDGKQLVNIFRYDNRKKKFDTVMVFYKERKFKEACELMNDILKGKDVGAYEYKIARFCYTMAGDFKVAKELNDFIFKTYPLKKDDYQMAGYIYGRLNHPEIAIGHYSKFIEIDSTEAQVFNNRACEYNKINKYYDAIEDCNQALLLNPDFIYSYNNRAYAYIKTGKDAEALKDIVRSLELNERNAHGYYNLVLLHAAKGNYSEATINFNLAKKYNLDPKLIEECLKLIDERS